MLVGVQVRVTSVADAMRNGKTALVLRARALSRALPPCAAVPSVVRTCKDQRALAEVGPCVCAHMRICVSLFCVCVLCVCLVYVHHVRVMHFLGVALTQLDA